MPTCHAEHCLGTLLPPCTSSVLRKVLIIKFIIKLLNPKNRGLSKVRIIIHHASINQYAVIILLASNIVACKLCIDESWGEEVFPPSDARVFMSARWTLWDARTYSRLTVLTAPSLCAIAPAQNSVFSVEIKQNSS